jgi:hypothetical protein
MILLCPYYFETINNAFDRFPVFDGAARGDVEGTFLSKKKG